MSRRSGERAKTPSGYDARHAKPGAPGPAALLGTAAKAVPVTLAVGAAGSALALSGTASAATVPAGLAGGSLVSSGAADVAAMKTAHIVLTRAHHAVHHTGHRSAYTVASGDTLSRISARFCGTARLPGVVVSSRRMAPMERCPPPRTAWRMPRAAR